MEDAGKPGANVIMDIRMLSLFLMLIFPFVSRDMRTIVSFQISIDYFYHFVVDDALFKHLAFPLKNETNAVMSLSLFPRLQNLRQKKYLNQISNTQTRFYLH